MQNIRELAKYMAYNPNYEFMYIKAVQTVGILQVAVRLQQKIRERGIMKMKENRFIFCHLCPNHCGLIATLEDGKVLDVETDIY